MSTDHKMTLEEKNETLRDLGACIQLAKRYFDSGCDMISVSVGHWTIEFDNRQSKDNKEEIRVANYASIGAVCDDCARAAGFTPKDKAVGIWMDNCEICHKWKPCTDLGHDWKRPTKLKGLK